MTQSRIVHGAVAGIAGGVVFGIMMQMMMAPTPDGQQMPMMKMVAMVVRSDSLTAGWLYHLFNSALIGALFGLVLGGRVISYGTGLWLGAAWGILWWVLGALILMPVLLGMEPFASLRLAPMRPVAMGSLIGHLVYGMLLGAIYRRAEARAPSVPARTSP